MGGTIPRGVRTSLTVLGAAVGVSLLLPTGPATAHNSLTGSDPRDGARVARPPAQIELRFLSRPDPNTTKITVVGPDNVTAVGGAPHFTGSRVSVPFRPGAAGLYIVGYQVASGDGHPVKGELRFTLSAGAPAAPSSGAVPAVSPPLVVPPSPSPTDAVATATPVPAADRRSDDGATRWPWAVGGVALLAGLAGLAALLLRRRSNTR